MWLIFARQVEILVTFYCSGVLNYEVIKIVGKYVSLGALCPGVSYFLIML